MGSRASASASTIYLKKIIRNGYEPQMQHELEKLLQNCPDHEREKHLNRNQGFLKLFKAYIKQSAAPIIWDEIQPFPRGALLDYDHFLIPPRPVIQCLLGKLVVIKLNGGLGTRMRCNGPKSLIPVRNGLTFLDLTVQQLENLNAEFESNIPLVLMNSFNTINETEKMIHKYRNLRIKIYTFEQNCYPRIYADSKNILPSSYNDPDHSAWYPPGHGDFYESFVKSGLLEKFKSQGKEYCFVSNIDNLGAIVDFRILDLMKNARTYPPPEFIMEVTNKTAADIKGGTLIHYMGRLKLLEYAEVPRDHVEEFKCTRKFNNFNTNNLWMKLHAIEKLVKNNELSLDVIPNTKAIEKEGNKVDVIQLETAAGAAIQYFPGAMGILVPRSRFLPVKTTSDLFLVRSNVFVNDNGKLIMNPIRPFADVPIVSLSDEHFGNFADLDKRFVKMPDCLQLQHLTVCGNVYFAQDVSFIGNVTIVAQNGERMDIPRGSVLQYKIVTGSLRIVDF